MPAAAPRPLRLLVGDFNATLDHDQFRELLDHVLVDERVGVELDPRDPGKRSPGRVRAELTLPPIP